MPTLRTANGASIVPDISRGLNSLQQGVQFGLFRGDRQQEIEEANAREDFLLGVKDGRDQRFGQLSNQALNAGNDEQFNASLSAMLAIDPEGTKNFLDVVKTKDERALQIIDRDRETSARNIALIKSGKDLPAKRVQIRAAAERAALSGDKPRVTKLMDLLPLNEDELEAKLRTGEIMALNAKAIQDRLNPPVQFEAVRDDQGNITGQRNLATGEVKADPRAVETSTPLTAQGKINEDLRRGNITGQQASQAEQALIKKAPTPQFKTKVAQGIADRELAIKLYGENSPQVRAIEDGIKADSNGEKPKLSEVAGIRKEFTGLSSDFITTRDAFEKINKASNDAAGDIAVVFNFMKLLDPSSKVTQGEIATVDNAGGVPSRIRGIWNNLFGGQTLDPKIRQQVIAQASNDFGAQLKAQKKLESVFTGLAERQGMNPKNVVIDFIGNATPQDEPGVTKVGKFKVRVK